MGQRKHSLSQIAEIIGGISSKCRHWFAEAHRLNLSAKIKTRNATNNQNFENSQDIKNEKFKK